ncbi:hypothetical protein [Streptomyces sp. Ag109_O5-10]|uniref:hypothetical protein n=1 Tax=Streptomyces sp. Ag109_O5-10 TaxID=1855349 RepID=UPI000A5B7F41|nr:hypothetical protein [Streptomyces sp. Ag109_O5-10]
MKTKALSRNRFNVCVKAGLFLDDEPGSWTYAPAPCSTLKIYVASGSGTTPFLSAGTSIDAIDLPA